MDFGTVVTPGGTPIDSVGAGTGILSGANPYIGLATAGLGALGSIFGAQGGGPAYSGVSNSGNLSYVGNFALGGATASGDASLDPASGATGTNAMMPLIMMAAVAVAAVVSK